MDNKLALKAWLGVLATPIIFGVLIFLPAGTLDYWKAWVFIAVFSVATALHTLELLKNDPEVLKRRMRAGPGAEQRPAQRIIMVFVMISFLLLPVISGFDHRYGWSHVPVWLVVIGDCLIALSYLVFYIVLKENRFASATIQVAEGQSLASRGLYGIVRHPMYAGAVLLMLAIPLALGSYWSLLVLLVALPALHWRILDEEKCLTADLQGYQEYCGKVKYRLIPGLY
jgi:protein-S-isoprenylcysteine O-methyltransferase Ste14